jgi:hypothetical protein
MTVEKTTATGSRTTAQCDAIAHALEELIELWKHKRCYGKDKHYLTNQPRIWQQAEEALAKYKKS